MLDEGLSIEEVKIMPLLDELRDLVESLGFDSKTVITGDTTQSDLPGGTPVGLVLAIDILKPIQGIKFVHFTGKDVVRHELVQKIIAAYEKISTARLSCL